MKSLLGSVTNEILTQRSSGLTCPAGFGITYGSMSGDGFFEESNKVTAESVLLGFWEGAQ